MKKHVLQLLFLWVGLCACGTKETYFIPKEMDCIAFPFLFSSHLMYNSNYSCDSLLYFVDVENHDSMIVCKVSKGEVVILDTASLPNAGHLFEMFIFGFDSIASFEFLPKRLMTLYRNDGSVIGTHDISDYGPYTNMVSQQPRMGNTICFANTNDSIASKGVLRKEYFAATNPVYQYDFESGEGKSWGSFPDKFATALGYEQTPMICMVNDSTFVVSFSCVDSLYLYVNGKLQSRHHCKSRYIDRFPVCDTTKMFDLGYYRQFTKLRPEYIDLLYDPSSQRFFRIAVHEKPFEEQSTKVKETNRTWSVLVINKDMKLETEYLFHYQDYVPFYVIPTHGGVYISKTPKSEDDMKLMLSLFKL